MLRKQRDALFFRAQLLSMFVNVFAGIFMTTIGLATAQITYLALKDEQRESKIFFAAVMGVLMILFLMHLCRSKNVASAIVTSLVPGCGFDYHIIRMTGKETSYQTNKWHIETDDGKYYLTVCGSKITLTEDEYADLRFFTSFKKKPWITLTREQYRKLLRHS